MATSLSRAKKQKYFEFSKPNYNIVKGDKYYFINKDKRFKNITKVNFPCLTSRLGFSASLTPYPDFSTDLNSDSRYRILEKICLYFFYSANTSFIYFVIPSNIIFILAFKSLSILLPHSLHSYTLLFISLYPLLWFPQWLHIWLDLN